MRTTLFIFAILIVFAFAKIQKGSDQAVDCEKCKHDIMEAVKDCGGFPNILQCIEDILMGLGECLVSKLDYLWFIIIIFLYNS